LRRVDTHDRRLRVEQVFDSEAERVLLTDLITARQSEQVIALLHAAAGRECVDRTWPKKKAALVAECGLR
jgi:hypothetical protein